ncbi:MAG: chromate transporter [Firmicutes bacterium]|nr:chromate transporter [Bacillota bacterium]
MGLIDYSKLLGLFFSFLRLGFFTFGGGFAMIPIIERELVRRKGWLTEDELIDSLSVIQALPGAVAVNTALMVGYQVAGGLGAALAAVGVIIPSFLVILGIAGVYHQVQDSALANAFLDGVRPVVIGLIGAAAVKIGRRVLHSWGSWVISLVTFVLVTGFGLSPVLALIIAAAVGLILQSATSNEDDTDDPAY